MLSESTSVEETLTTRPKRKKPNDDSPDILSKPVDVVVTVERIVVVKVI